MEKNSLLLCLLPPELLCLIIWHLDPIALIALSQTSKASRAIIKPTSHDFKKRLLALELLPNFCGLAPVHSPRGIYPSVLIELEEWRKLRHACCGCIKLPPHYMFDQRAMRKVTFRKPSPGSVEANRMLRTDWEPLSHAARWRRIHDRGRAERINTEVERMQCATAEEEERYMSGTSRQKRRCNECKFKQGH
ncbi:hypothetical protein QBC44DRAFT_386574 [Cladorrhinum sp. PSN332]|nr:hypothetical protein QBC44DRAFT_386574 [Cladorrhinum sp. PSN332]